MARKSKSSRLVKHALDFWGAWGLRFAVLFSVGAHVALVFLARTRRQHVSIWGKLLLWPAYMIATEMSATYALGKLSLSDDTTATTCEHQVVAFWAPFLLLHLGFPDNISAYALEDNKLSGRQAIDVIQRVLGALFILYKYIYHGDGGNLRPASAIMFVVGAFKYMERFYALKRGNLDHIRDSMKKKPVVPLKPVVRGPTLDDEEALLFAHEMFHFCKRAMVDDSSFEEVDDSSSEEDKDSIASSERIFSLECRSMWRVLEMELSLMYDILYSKEALIHTWGGYLIRLFAPPATAAATVLFFLFPKDCINSTADVIITYILLAVAVLLDVVWLARALGSTWAYAFLKGRLAASLHRAVLCRGWRRLRNIVMFLDPSHWLLGRDPRCYRRWSGKFGRYNLLEECTRVRDWTSDLRCWLLAEIGLEDPRFVFQLCPKVKMLLFQRILRRLTMQDSGSGKKSPGDPYTMLDITKNWGQVAVNRRPEVFPKDDEPSFGREFQEDILVWHIGTSIFLAYADQQREGNCGKYAKAIEALSEYLMFLVAQRPHMLPGLELRSLFQVTRRALIEVWSPSNKNSSSKSSKNKFAKILYEKSLKDEYWGKRKDDNANIRLMTDGAELGMFLLEKITKSNEEEMKIMDMQEMLEFIFDVWVDKLLHAGTGCSRESHAKQLSRGGELATIVWIMTEHAVPFRIGEMPDYPDEDKTKKEEEEKKKKEAEEKKKKEEEEKKPDYRYPPMPAPAP
ncbi:hypothetical protein EJB05_51987, partial [Eragrostis curvula]